ncbi:MAG: DUF1080 domain-containing protein, partial [Tannerellaceae bacterium]|nr:DUF1080 domain-containing protein [Tannerellaceae bacterium]
MKKAVLFTAAILTLGFLTACGGGKKQQAAVAEEGWESIFDGKTFNGWRGYNKPDMPAAWVIEDGAIKIQGSGAGEAGATNGGDIIFDRKFKNFELELEWKVGKG